jgi:pimeloyl-ACP methyl ester carboxylesterase
MMAAKPTIILTPGSWHVPAHFQPTTDVLISHGYKVVGVRTPSVRDSGPYTANLSADAAAVSSAILTEVDQANEVVLVMHSYGGVPGSAAVEGLSKSDREKKGLKGGVIRLVYLAAIVLDVGMSVWKLFLQDQAKIDNFINEGKIDGYWTTVHDVSLMKPVASIHSDASLEISHLA